MAHVEAAVAGLLMIQPVCLCRASIVMVYSTSGGRDVEWCITLFWQSGSLQESGPHIDPKIVGLALQGLAKRGP